MQKYLVTLSRPFRGGYLKLMAFAVTLMTLGGAAMAQTETVWTTAETAVDTNNTALGAFLIAMLVIPLAFFAWRLIKRALG